MDLSLIHICAEEAYERMASQEVVVVDVRTREEYDGGHIENAVLVPNESIGSEMPEALLDKEATLLIYCRSGRRSKDAAQKLLKLGYQSVYDFGGVIDWPYELVKAVSYTHLDVYKRQYSVIPVMRFSFSISFIRSMRTSQAKMKSA